MAPSPQIYWLTDNLSIIHIPNYRLQSAGWRQKNKKGEKEQNKRRDVLLFFTTTTSLSESKNICPFVLLYQCSCSKRLRKTNIIKCSGQHCHNRLRNHCYQQMNTFGCSLAEDRNIQYFGVTSGLLKVLENHTDFPGSIGQLPYDEWMINLSETGLQKVVEILCHCECFFGF